MSIIQAIIFGGLFVFYASQVFLFSEKDSHFGPWPSKTRRVVWTRVTVPDKSDHSSFSYREYTQPVTLFDWVRRFFGAYAIEVIDSDDGGRKGREEVWYVKDANIEVWTCPICLSFWISLIPTIVYLILGGAPLIAACLPFALSAVSVILHSFNDTLQGLTSWLTEEPILTLADEDTE